MCPATHRGMEIGDSQSCWTSGPSHSGPVLPATVLALGNAGREVFTRWASRLTARPLLIASGFQHVPWPRESKSFGIPGGAPGLAWDASRQPQLFPATAFSILTSTALAGRLETLNLCVLYKPFPLLSTQTKPVHISGTAAANAEPGASLEASWQRIRWQCKRCKFDSRAGKIPWRRAWQPPPVFLPGESHGWRSLAGLQSIGSQRAARTE